MAARNPNPTYITDDMWWLWLECLGFIPGVRLGGIYANKSGYHNTVNANLANWPGNYSVRYAIDRRDPKTKARAIDLTMSSTWMKTITRRLIDGAARRDKRMRCVKEFYGTLNGTTVVGRIKDSEDGPYRSASSDASHTWHEHVGILTPYVDDRDAIEGLASLLSGEAWEAWIARKYGGSLPTLPISGIPEPTLREGDTGPRVVALQVYLNGVLDAGLDEDGRYGPATTASVRELQQLARITIDGIYGDDSATALRNLLEDDMPTPKELWHTDGLIDAPTDAPDRATNPTWAPASAMRGVLDRVYHLPRELAAIRAGQAAVLAVVQGLDTKAVLAAIDKAATADATRDAALLAELRDLANGGADAEAILDALAVRLANPTQ